MEGGLHVCVHEGRGQMEDCKGGSCSEGEGVRERGRGGEAVVDVFQNLGTLLHNRGIIGRESNEGIPLYLGGRNMHVHVHVYMHTHGV